MSILRLFAAWLVMTALPVQGIAAASMLFCGQTVPSTAVQASAVVHSADDHAVHGHGGQRVDHGSHEGHHAAAGAAALGLDEAQAGPHEDGHAFQAGDDRACPICAACCNLVALHDLPTPSLGAARPAPPALAGPSRVITREASAPDKPPRA